MKKLIFLTLIIFNLFSHEGVPGGPEINEGLEGQPAISPMFKATLNLNPKIKAAFDKFTQDKNLKHLSKKLWIKTVVNLNNIKRERSNHPEHLEITKTNNHLRVTNKNTGNRAHIKTKYIFGDIFIVGNDLLVFKYKPKGGCLKKEVKYKIFIGRYDYSTGKKLKTYPLIKCPEYTSLVENCTYYNFIKLLDDNIVWSTIGFNTAIILEQNYGTALQVLNEPKNIFVQLNSDQAVFIALLEQYSYYVPSIIFTKFAKATGLNADYLRSVFYKFNNQQRNVLTEIFNINLD